MKTTRLILVGGFLGAGKTTLLWEASKRFMNNNQRVGLITNDQAPELVDTTLLLHNNIKVSEVSGSCFCCNFNGFIDAIRQVRNDAQADILIAEPVGSCTDLSATIMQPLKDLMKTELVVAPLTVLADPARLVDILEGGNADLHLSAAYIYRKQLEESDIILINKTDLMKKEELESLVKKVKQRFPETLVVPISCKNGEGIDAWLNMILESDMAGQRLVEVDYDTYAEGEAVLGWLNGTIALSGQQINWDEFAKKFLAMLSQKIDSKGAAVGHVKILLEAGDKYTIGNLTGKFNTLSFREMVGISNEAQIIINARVGISPEALDQMVKETLNSISGDTVLLEIKAWRCLSPGYPNPTHRYNRVA